MVWKLIFDVIVSDCALFLHLIYSKHQHFNYSWEYKELECTNANAITSKIGFLTMMFSIKFEVVCNLLIHYLLYYYYVLSSLRLQRVQLQKLVNMEHAMWSFETNPRTSNVVRSCHAFLQFIILWPIHEEL